MLWLVASLCFAHIALGIRPKIISALDQNEKSEGYYGPTPTTQAPYTYPPTTTTTQAPYYPPTTTTQAPYTYPPTTTTTQAPSTYPPTTTTTQAPYTYPPTTTTTQAPYTYPPTTTTTQAPYTYPPITTTTTRAPYYPPYYTTIKPTKAPVSTKPVIRMANGFPILASRTRGLLEQCLIDQFLDDEFGCGNNPYAGLLRLGFHDCGTFDSTNTQYPGGCNAWSSIHCTDFDACEFTSKDNEGLQPWVLKLDTMYDSSLINGQPLSTLLSRADFWQLAINRVIQRASDFNISVSYWAGRFDPQQIYSNPQSFGPRFPGRLPQAFAFSEMERVAKRNNLTNFHASALLGGHSLGQAHPTVSGFRGSWDPTPAILDNFYWKVLQEEVWHITHVEAINQFTGQATNKTQYSLGGVNEKSSIQLFADLNQLVDTTAPNNECPVVHVFTPNAACPGNDPQIFEEPASAKIVLEAWALDPSTFFEAFRQAWDIVSQWGCDQNGPCPFVQPYTSKITQCGINLYRHKCTPMYSSVPPPWGYPVGRDETANGAGLGAAGPGAAGPGAAGPGDDGDGGDDILSKEKAYQDKS